ncbi:NUDIX hydrolase [Leptospira perolatii]|uniref:NUDIX hydrolase n=1 Tax=Leptospira perolatii TaxID=2023191 RepID=UPI003C6D1DA1
MKVDLERIKNNNPLRVESEVQIPEDITDSSVVIPIYRTPEGDGFLLQQRSHNLVSHPGQIAFPGGARDPEDENLLSTALREWTEEMGAPAEDLEIIGTYKGYFTHTGFHITPYLAVYHGDFVFDFNQEEVERIIRLDLSRLWSEPFYSLHVRRNPSSPLMELFYFDLEEGLLWGATARIIVNFLREHCDFSRPPMIREMNLPGPPFFDPKKS